MHSATYCTPLWALLVQWHHCFTQQTCSIHTRNFVLAQPHGRWADFCPTFTQKLPSIKRFGETLQVFATWSSCESLSFCSKAGTRPMPFCCQWSSLTARSYWLTLLLPCPSLFTLPETWSYLPCEYCSICPQQGPGCCRGKFLQEPTWLIGSSPEGHSIWLGTHYQYNDAKQSAGGVHLDEIVHMDINQSWCHVLHLIRYISNISYIYIYM